MKRILLLCLFFAVMGLRAQININIGSSEVGTAPVSSFFSYSYVQQIYPKQEINAGTPGSITGLTFYIDPSSTITESSDWTVYLGHTTKMAFASGTDWIPVSQLTQVFAGTVTKSNNKVQVNFTTPFAYNNIDNLVIAARENASNIDINNFDEAFHVYSHLPNSTLYYKGDRAVVDPAAPPGGIRAGYKSAVTLSGLTANATPACPFITYPANNTQNVALSPGITWLPVSGADSYKISLGTNPGGTDILNQQVVSGNSFSPSTALAPGMSYYLKITSVAANVTSSGCSELTFKTVPPVPANDACSGAFLASAFPYTYTQDDAVSATNNAGNISVCSVSGNTGMNDGTWFKFTGDGSQYTITVTMPSGSSFDPEVGVYSGSCSNLSCVDTVDNAGGGGAENITVTTTAGAEYFVNVGAYDDTTDAPEGTFTITITKI
ncbi:hypothetical protein [Chryseobacterium gallinarum]|uniref:Fibronectin type-III domain-containing protein n=1 Tax=Chryseobacterium gallinarum TaxID=1324352 RepID=A0ABX6KND3_CHRGL|nr:hypothetical protein [Chryseobacterium gallinarum]QIY89258.1 hypothetical protein FOB44_00745 [Chryseobacterium gallinarum]